MTRFVQTRSTDNDYPVPLEMPEVPEGVRNFLSRFEEHVMTDFAQINSANNDYPGPWEMLELIDEFGFHLSAWEKHFIDSIQSQDSPLTAWQMYELRRIYDNVVKGEY